MLSASRAPRSGDWVTSKSPIPSRMSRRILKWVFQSWPPPSTKWIFDLLRRLTAGDEDRENRKRQAQSEVSSQSHSFPLGGLTTNRTNKQPRKSYSPRMARRARIREEGIDGFETQKFSIGGRRYCNSLECPGEERVAGSFLFLLPSSVIRRLSSALIRVLREIRG